MLKDSCERVDAGYDDSGSVSDICTELFVHCGVWLFNRKI